MARSLLAEIRQLTFYSVMIFAIGPLISVEQCVSIQLLILLVIF